MPDIVVHKTQALIQSYKDLSKILVLEGRLQRWYHLSWYQMFYYVNTGYAVINNTYMPNAPSWKEDNLRPPNTMTISGTSNPESIICEATAPVQQPCHIFIFMSKLISPGSCVCRQFAGVKFMPFNSDINISLIDNWKWWYNRPFKKSYKVFWYAQVVGNNNGFRSRSTTGWFIVD